MNEHDYRPIAHARLNTAGAATIALLALGVDLFAVPEGSVVAWVLRGVAIVAAAVALALVGIEVYQSRWGPRLVYRADPDTGRVTSHATNGPENLEGALGFHCVVRLRGWRHRAEVFHAGVRTGMSLAVVRCDPEAGEVLALWRDGHAIESTVYVRIDDLLVALAVLSDAEVRLLLSSEHSEPMAGLVFALIGRRMASYKTERDRAQWELGVSQAALTAAEDQVRELTTALEAAESRAHGWSRGQSTSDDSEGDADGLDEITINEERLRERAREVEPRPIAGGRVGRAVGKVMGVAAQVADAAGHVAERVASRVKGSGESVSPGGHPEPPADPE